MKLFDELYKDIQVDLFNQIAETEREIIKSYRVALESVQQELSELYRKYSKNGELFWTEMNRYNRLSKLEKAIRTQLQSQLLNIDRQIERRTKEAFEESFLRHAWAIDQDSGFPQSWGNVSNEMVEKAVYNPLSKLSDSKAMATARAGTIGKIRNEITLSLVRGESYYKMSQRIGKVMGFNKNGRFTDSGAAYKSLRIARTEGARVQVQGQEAAYERARELGIEVEEVWDATLDSKTRASHGQMDGRKRGKDGMFDSPVGKIPGPLQSGIASFDIQCRCTVRGQIPGYPPQQRWSEGDGEIPWVNYEEWQKGLKRGKYTSPSLTEKQKVKKKAQFKKARAKAKKMFPSEKWEKVSENVYVAESRKPVNKQQRLVLEKEIRGARAFVREGYVVHLLPEQVPGKSIDALVNGNFVEMKSITGGLKQIGKRYQSAFAKPGCSRVFLEIAQNFSYSDVYNKIKGEALAVKHTKGVVYVLLNGKFYVWSIAKMIK